MAKKAWELESKFYDGINFLRSPCDCVAVHSGSQKNVFRGATTALMLYFKLLLNGEYQRNLSISGSSCLS